VFSVYLSVNTEYTSVFSLPKC